ncbi:surface lipoprotein assembly modifier [Roseovarius aestuarii]|nr:surface lipoprotein assembly modifier [Roseovarius aestuarii]
MGGQFHVLWMRVAVLGVFFAWAMPLVAETAMPSDWTRAITLMRNGQAEAALPHLERLVRTYPDVAEYRLELGYALFQTERDTRARYHIEQARGGALTPQQHRAAAALLDVIESRKIWSVRLDFAVEPSSNAGRGTVASSVEVGGLVFNIPNTARAKPATGLRLSAGVTVAPRLDAVTRAVLSLDTRIKYYEDTALRETQVLGRAGINRAVGENTTIEAGILAGQTYAGGGHYSDRFGVYAAYTLPVGQRAFGRVAVERYEMDHANFTIADGSRTVVSAQLRYALSGQTLLRSSAYVMRSDSVSSLQSGWEGALTLGVMHAFRGGLVAHVDVTAGLDKRDGVSRLTGVARRDRSVALSTEIYDSRLKIGRFLPVLKLGYEKNQSNELLNEYTNRTVSIGFRTAF